MSKRIITFSLILLCFGSAKAQHADSLALVTIYNAAGGNSWSRPWDLSAPVRTWAGVSLNESGRVTVLRLNSRKLAGSIPGTISGLSELQRLEVNNNPSLKLSLEQLFGLSKLQALTAAKCQIGSAIPNGISALSELRTLNLSGTGLEGTLPNALFSLTKMVTLNLSSNKLSGTVQAGIGALKQLQLLDFSNNEFEGEPVSQIGSLNKLKELYMQDNGFTGRIPGSFGNLNRLEIMNLSNNDLEGAVPSSFQQLKRLQDLNLSKNMLSGNLHSWFGGQEEIRKFQVQDNLIGGTLPEDMSLMTKMRYMDFSKNKVEEEIPESFGSMTVLLHLDGSENLLYGEIPETFGNLTILSYCDLSENNLGGNLPESFYFLVSLRHLNLSHNDISGSIPPKIDKLTELAYLNLSYNNFTGGVPGTLGALEKLTYFNASNNGIWYTINDNITGMDKLRHLDLSHNEIIGGIPVRIGHMTSLQYLDLSSNKLRSRIPANIQLLTNLRNLHLDNNALEGAVPPGIDSLIELRQLTLHNNQFVDLPPFTHLENLSKLSVENNFLTFEDLEYNVGLFGKFTYAPQADVPLETPCYLRVEVAGTANRYRWFYENDSIPGARDSVHAARNPGIYYAEITNDIATELTLRSEQEDILHTVPPLDLKKDTVFCEPFSLILDAGEGEEYEWSTGEDTRTITVTEEGIYSVRVEKTICEAYDSIEVIYRGARNNTVSPELQVLCAGQAPDTLFAGVSDSLHTYLWQKSEDGETWADLDSGLIHIPDTLLQSTYFRRLVSTDSCGIQESNTVRVLVSDAKAEFEITEPSCSSESNAEIRPVITNAFEPFRYLWSTGDTSEVLQNIGGGDYTLWVQDSLGCESEFHVSIIAPEPLEVSPQVSPASCNSTARDASVFLEIKGGTPPFSVTWSNGMEGSEIKGLGIYDSIPLTGIVEDAQGCTKDVKVFTYRRKAIDASFSYESEQYCRINPDPLPEISGRRGGIFFAEPYGLSIDSESGMIDLSESESGTYRIVYEADECSRDTALFVVESGCLDDIPNTFTPNDDGANDTWIIPGLELYPQAVVRIYDSAGKSVFISEPGYHNPWNGRKNGYPLVEGAYFYEINFGTGGEFKKQHKGFVMLVR